MTVGSQLQRARLDRKLSLANVTEKTKIQPWVLEAIEADRLQEMMSPIYVKGFIGTYARFLRLDPETVLAQLPWPQPPEPPVQEATPPPAPAIPVAIRWPTLPLPLVRRLGTAAVICAAVAGVVIVNPLRWMPHISLPSFRLPTLVRHDTRTIHPSRRATPKVAKRPAPPQPSQPAAPLAPKLASVTPVNEPLKPPVPPALTVPLATEALELTIIANRATWVQVRADGKLITQERLPRGANERWTAKKQFELVVAKPTQVEVTLNGQPITPFAIAHQGRILITHHGVTQLPESGN